MLPTFLTEFDETSARLTFGPADDVPLYDTVQRHTWLAAAIVKLRRIERLHRERLILQAAADAIAATLAAKQKSRRLPACHDDDL